MIDNFPFLLMSKNNNIKVIIVKVNKKNEYDDKGVTNLTTIIF